MDEQLNIGKINESSLIWHEGLKDWTSLGAVFACSIDATVLPPRILPESKHQAYFNVPVWRLVLMWFASCTVFEFLWMYRNWNYIKRRDNLPIDPGLRAFFDIVFFIPLLDQMKRDHVASRSQACLPSLSLVGGAFTALKASSWICQIAARQTEGVIRVFFIAIAVLTTVLTVLCLARIQAYVCALNSEINPSVQFAPWSRGQTITLVVGLLVWTGLLMAIFESLSK